MKKVEGQKRSGWSIWYHGRYWLRRKRVLGRESLQELWQCENQKVRWKRWDMEDIWCCGLGIICHLMFSENLEQRLKLLCDAFGCWALSVTVILCWVWTQWYLDLFYLHIDGIISIILFWNPFCLNSCHENLHFF
jgi:hypothetical protein